MSSCVICSTAAKAKHFFLNITIRKCSVGIITRPDAVHLNTEESPLQCYSSKHNNWEFEMTEFLLVVAFRVIDCLPSYEDNINVLVLNDMTCLIFIDDKQLTNITDYVPVKKIFL